MSIELLRDGAKLLSGPRRLPAVDFHSSTAEETDRRPQFGKRLTNPLADIEFSTIQSQCGFINPLFETKPGHWKLSLK
jgi:hypothetical protein